ncbi:MAG: hypothetical protein ACK5O2_11970 [Microthrixaceae bacterium]
MSDDPTGRTESTEGDPDGGQDTEGAVLYGYTPYDEAYGDSGDVLVGGSGFRGRFRRAMTRIGNQGARIILLVAIVAIAGMGLGYAAGFPLRYIDYTPSSAVSLDQPSLAGTVDVQAALVAQDDLGEGWVPGDPTLAAFGVLGADVCGEPIETPTPLSSVEAVVWSDETNGAMIIAQALRVDKWSSAEEYIREVTKGLADCDTFFRVDSGERVKVVSTDIERDPPVTDHVDRRFQSPNGVQDWSMMVVGDVIIAIQYLAPTPSPEGFMESVERAVLARVAPREFAPGGVAVVTEVPAEPGADPAGATSDTAPPDATGTTEVDTGAADETGGD